ncbi:RDD family protein [Actinoalloteichus hymeniacidonis]|uniref:RDD family protein n=1 Tax=Actinoalloteichus hymeniacidonis TaxID=340345 RepID=UPI000852CBA7|nr:RDD family protein [Actinoalloteichus hymeniacidonis]MBB5906751.1 putative RDD family membrane protein YckC [Actinoalloteichus hymeniacidonis]
MNRLTGSWLSGPSAALPEGERREQVRQDWRGQRLGLPEQGPDAVATKTSRAGALLIDLLLAALIAGLFTAPELPRHWSLLVWALLTILPVATVGFTPGMALLGIRVARIGEHPFVGPVRALVRTALIFLIVPAVIWDADARGLHDKAAGTVVVRTR